MSEKREFVKRLLDEARASDVEAEPIREVDVDSQGLFLDMNTKRPIQDPLRFDEEGVRDRLVLVNFFASRLESQRPVMTNLARVAELLGDRVGRDVFINSVTLQPELDTRARLEQFALDLRAPRGWTFVRATPEATGELVARMNRLRGYTSSELVFYGKPGGYWGMFPALNSPEELADRLIGAMPGQKAATLRRAGPAIRNQEPRSWSAREI